MLQNYLQQVNTTSNSKGSRKNKKIHECEFGSSKGQKEQKEIKENKNS